MTLDYTVPVGDLAPYFDGLKAGKACATTCVDCGKVAFPARLLCGFCGGKNLNWVSLPGTAHLLFRTDSGTRGFALVKFDGADTHSTVALRNPQTTTTSGRLTAHPGEPPGIWLALKDEERGDGR